jgi:hypothetical protein
MVLAVPSLLTINACPSRIFVRSNAIDAANPGVVILIAMTRFPAAG